MRAARPGVYVLHLPPTLNPARLLCAPPSRLCFGESRRIPFWKALGRCLEVVPGGPQIRKSLGPSFQGSGRVSGRSSNPSVFVTRCPAILCTHLRPSTSVPAIERVRQLAPHQVPGLCPGGQGGPISGKQVTKNDSAWHALSRDKYPADAQGRKGAPNREKALLACTIFRAYAGSLTKVNTLTPKGPEMLQIA